MAKLEFLMMVKRRLEQYSKQNIIFFYEKLFEIVRLLISGQLALFCSKFQIWWIDGR